MKITEVLHILKEVDMNAIFVSGNVRIYNGYQLLGNYTGVFIEFMQYGDSFPLFNDDRFKSVIDDLDREWDLSDYRNNLDESQFKLYVDLKSANKYLNIAETIARESKCLRKQYGAVIVANDEIISTGYNGPPRGVKHCTVCERNRLNIKPGTMYETCRAVHSEANAIISASRRDMINAVIYLAGKENGNYVKNISCCVMCKRMIINAGIKFVVYRLDGANYAVLSTDSWLSEL